MVGSQLTRSRGSPIRPRPEHQRELERLAACMNACLLHGCVVVSGSPPRLAYRTSMSYALVKERAALNHAAVPQYGDPVPRPSKRSCLECPSKKRRLELDRAFVLAAAFGVSAACVGLPPPPPARGEGSTSTGSTDAASLGSTTMTSATSATSATSETGAESSETSSGSIGYCAVPCMTTDACVTMGDSEADWTCTDGFCVYTPVCDESTCPAKAGLACLEVDGVSSCVIACPNGDECFVHMLECVMHAGFAYCEIPPCGGAAEGEPCEYGSFGQYGTCTDGVCVCSSDSECTLTDQVCNKHS